MKKNFYYLSLLLGLVFGMTMFTACGGDDDDSSVMSPFGGKIEGPIEGTWYLKSEKWIHYIKGGEIYEQGENDGVLRTYDDYYPNQTLTISKSGDKYTMLYEKIYKADIPNEEPQHHVLPLNQVGEYDFMASMQYDGQRIVIISSTSNSLTVGWYEDYDKSVEGKSREYGILTFMK